MQAYCPRNSLKIIAHPWKILLCSIFLQLSACGGNGGFPGNPPEVEGCEFLQFAFELRPLTLECDSLEDLDKAATYDAVLKLLIKETAVAERLDLSGFKNLEKLDIKSSNIGVLDLSRNLELKEIWLETSGLSELHLPAASISTVHLDTPALTHLTAFGAEIKHLTLVGPLNQDIREQLLAQPIPQLSLVNFNLADLSLDELDSLAELWLMNCQFEELHLPGQRPISLSVRGITPTNLSIATGQIEKLSVWNTRTASISVSESEFWNILQLNDHESDSLDISGGESITSIEVKGGVLQELSGAALPALRRISISNATISNLDLSTNQALESFWVWDTSFGSVSLPETAPLALLDLSEVTLAELDIPEYPDLKKIYISNTSLRQLNTQTLAGLTDFTLISTEISALALDKMPSLNNLYITGHQFTELDLSGNLQLKQLTLAEISGIADLDVSHLDLTRLRISDSDLSCGRLQVLHEKYSGLGQDLFLPEFTDC